MTAPPPYLDIGEHERVGKRRGRPRLTGVAALLEQRHGLTALVYECAEGVVTVRLGWKVHEAELRQLDDEAESHADGTAYALVGALASLLRCDLEYELTREVVGG